MDHCWGSVRSIRAYVKELSWERLSSAIGLQLSSKSDIRVEDVAMNNYRGIKEKVREMVQLVSGRQIMEGGSECQVCVEHLISFVSKYDTLRKRSDKYLLLTSVPSWVTITKMMEVFGIRKRMAERASNIRNTIGPFSQPPPKAGHPIPLTTCALVHSLDNSRPSPDARDVRKGKAKHFLLLNQKELFGGFKLKYAAQKLSLSKFIQLAPQECVWRSRNGFRTTCLGIFHENFELLLGAIDIGGRTSDVLCNNPQQVSNFYCSDSPECLLGLCSDCPKWQKLSQALSDYEAEDIDYQQWVNAGQGEGVRLATFACPKDQFEQLFRDQTVKTAEHHLIYLQQKLHISSLKSFSGSTDKAHAVMLCDFGMNYSFLLPREIQGYHWSAQQATIHPFVLYHYNDFNHCVEEEDYVVISDCLDHDTSTFEAFKYEVLSSHIKPKFPYISSVTYISDGAGGTYKNWKNFANLLHHEEDYQIKADHVYSSSAGKAKCDILSAVAKRLTRSHSLKGTDPPVLNVSQMAEFLATHDGTEKRHYLFVCSERVSQVIQLLNLTERSSEYKTVPGTRQIHEVAPLNRCCILAKRFSGSSEVLQQHFLKSSNCQNNLPARVDSPIYKCGDYAGFVYNKSFYTGLILQSENEEGELFQMMKQSGRKGDYSWIIQEKIVSVPTIDMIAKLDAPCSTSAYARSYRYDLNEISRAKITAEKLIKERGRRSSRK